MMNSGVAEATQDTGVCRMETSRLDDLLRAVSDMPSRRGVARGLAAGALAAPVAALHSLADAEAKKKRKKKKKKKPPTGSATCPAGTTFYGSAGCVENEARAPAEFGGETGASGTCHAARRRLLTGAELIAYAHEPGVTIGTEWTGDIVVGAGGQPVALVVTDQSNVIFSPLIGTSHAFRCVTLPTL
jgi:hypothetical protein